MGAPDSRSQQGINLRGHVLKSLKSHWQLASKDAGKSFFNSKCNSSHRHVKLEIFSEKNHFIT